MKNTTSYYQEVVIYLLENRNKTYSTDEVKNAIHSPSRFIKLRKAIDKMSDDESYIRHEVKIITEKWSSKKTLVAQDEPELLRDCRFLMSHNLKITAIKTYRTGTGFGLKDSKDAVERL